MLSFILGFVGVYSAKHETRFFVEVSLGGDAWTMFRPQTHFYGSAAEAAEVASDLNRLNDGTIFRAVEKPAASFNAVV